MTLRPPHGRQQELLLTQCHTTTPQRRTTSRCQPYCVYMVPPNCISRWISIQCPASPPNCWLDATVQVLLDGEYDDADNHRDNIGPLGNTATETTSMATAKQLNWQFIDSSKTTDGVRRPCLPAGLTGVQVLMESSTATHQPRSTWAPATVQMEVTAAACTWMRGQVCQLRT